MKNTLRRWGNPLYRRAHRYELPCRQDVLTFLLCFVVIGVLSLIGHSYTMRKLAEGAQDQRALILACLNGKAALGYFEEHGQKWEVLCSTYYKEIK